MSGFYRYYILSVIRYYYSILVIIQALTKSLHQEYYQYVEIRRTQEHVPFTRAPFQINLKETQWPDKGIGKNPQNCKDIGYEILG